MSNFRLLPNRYKTLGWYLLIPAILVGVVLTLSDYDTFTINSKVFAIYNEEIFNGSQFFQFTDVDITPTLIGLFFIIGALLVAFSKEKHEDEYISSLRLTSLQWAILVNYVLLFISFLFIYGLGFINVMVYNMFTVLIIFIARFNYVIHISKKTASNEKYP